MVVADLMVMGKFVMIYELCGWFLFLVATVFCLYAPLRESLFFGGVV